MINLQGYACFVCETDEDLSDIGAEKTLECPRCSPTVTLIWRKVNAYLSIWVCTSSMTLGSFTWRIHFAACAYVLHLSVNSSSRKEKVPMETYM